MCFQQFLATNFCATGLCFFFSSVVSFLFPAKIYLIPTRHYGMGHYWECLGYATPTFPKVLQEDCLARHIQVVCNCQMLKCSHAQMIICSNAQMLKCSNAQILKCSICSNAHMLNMLKCSNAQMLKCSNAHLFVVQYHTTHRPAPVSSVCTRFWIAVVAVAQLDL